MNSTITIVSQAIVALCLIAGTMYLAWLEPNTRMLVAGVFTTGVGVVFGFFFSQHSTEVGASIIARVVAKQSEPAP